MAWLRTTLALVLTWTLAVSAEEWNPVARIPGLISLLPGSNETPISGSYMTEDDDDEWGDYYTDDDAVSQDGDTSTNLDLYGDHGYQVEYMDATGPRMAPRAPCPSPSEAPATTTNVAPGTGSTTPPQPTKPTNTLPENPKPSGCSIPKEQQVECGSSGISSSLCEGMGCCVNATTQDCFFPMDECTMDKQFVFAIHKDSTTVYVDPTTLVLPGTSCGPVIVNDEFAIFKFSVNECGTRAYEIGKTSIYLTEVQTPVQVRNLKYGAITRDDPVRFLVECRYSEEDPSGKRSRNRSGDGSLVGISKMSLISIGFMVQTPIVSSVATTMSSAGLFGVHLRIAEDETYTKYYDHDHQPLRLLLGKPVYLEVYLRSPRPRATLIVNYCLAYPRSAKNALVLIYEGCANRLDPTVAILQVSNPSKKLNQRRFVVHAFQFMNLKTNKYLDEEIYFMCSSELCMPLEKTCEKRCFDGKVATAVGV